MNTTASVGGGQTAAGKINATAATTRSTNQKKFWQSATIALSPLNPGNFGSVPHCSRASSALFHEGKRTQKNSKEKTDGVRQSRLESFN